MARGLHVDVARTDDMFDPSMLDRQTIAPERVRGLRRVEFEHLATVGLLADERV